MKKFREHDVSKVMVIEYMDRNVFAEALEACMEKYKVIDIQYAVYPVFMSAMGSEWVYSALVLVVEK